VQRDDPLLPSLAKADPDQALALDDVVAVEAGYLLAPETGEGSERQHGPDLRASGPDGQHQIVIVDRAWQGPACLWSDDGNRRVDLDQLLQHAPLVERVEVGDPQVAGVVPDLATFAGAPLVQE
jgi:hypothetical protein